MPLDLTTALLLVILLVLLAILARVWRGTGSATDVAAISTVVTRQLEATQATLGQRLDASSRTVADVREKLGQLAEATARLESVGQSVREVQDLLRVPRLRGTIGEIWLEELLRQVFPQGHYQMQYTLGSGARVDAVIRIGERLLAIDAKFPLEACQRMLAAGPEAFDRERRSFRKSVRERIDEIAERYIRPGDGTFEFALMYIPAESVYYEAMVRDEDLAGDSVLSYAMARRVIPVSPQTFYAYLSAVLHGLRGLQVEERARELLGEISQLEEYFVRFWSSYERVGTHLVNAEKQYAESERWAARVRGQLEALASPRTHSPGRHEDGATPGAHPHFPHSP